MPSHPLTFVALMLACCAATSGETAIDLFGTTQASISMAEQSGAKDVPAAALYWHLAQEQQQRAKRLVTAGRTSDAEMLLRRASLDAELAITLAQQAHALAAAKAAEQKVSAP
jgi:hypothetical protein